MITITHKSGPLAGTSQSFDDTKQRIEFGRDADKCDIVYPADATAVGHQHFALVRDPSGDWELHLYGDHFVSVDRVPAQPDQPIKSGEVFHLGPVGGPTFEVTVERGAPKDSKKTEPQPEPTPAPVAVRRLTIVGGVVALALIVTVGGWIYKNIADQKQVAATVASLAADQQKAQQDLARRRSAAAASFDQSVIDRLARATFLVYKQDAQGSKSVIGTAWVIGPSVLATNAHISARCDELPPDQRKPGSTCQDLAPGETLFVLQPGSNGASYEVVARSFHPGYVAFPKLVRSVDPVIADLWTGPSYVDTGFTNDVGLLTIKGELPAGLALQVASKDELMALKPGMPLASAGYLNPSAVLTVSATPQVHTGDIGALTDFLFLPTDPAHDYLIQHSIPEDVEGGSGSPIISASGHVIAIHNAGNVGTTGAPSGVEINYAQRADLVADLLAGRAQAAFDADKPYWVQEMAKFKRGIDAWSADALSKSKPNTKAVARLVSETPGKLEAQDAGIDPTTKKKQRVKIIKLDLSAGTPYFIFVYADNQTPIAIYVKGSDNRTLIDDTQSQWHPHMPFTPTSSGPWSLVVVGPDADTTFTTRLYDWQSSGS